MTYRVHEHEVIDLQTPRVELPAAEIEIHSTAELSHKVRVG